MKGVKFLISLSFILILISAINCDSNFTRTVLEEINVLSELTKENYEENVLIVASIFNLIYYDMKKTADLLREEQDKVYANLKNIQKNFILREIENSMEYRVVSHYAPISINVSACEKYSSFRNRLVLYTFIYDYNLRCHEGFLSFENVLRKTGINSEDKIFSKISKELLDVMNSVRDLFKDFKDTNVMLLKILFKYTEIFSFDDSCFEKFPCGTFIPFDVKNDINAPSKNGFKAGQWFDDTDAYIGSGFIEDPLTGEIEKESMGRLTINPSSPGVYLEDIHEQFNNVSAFYLLNHKNLKWINYNWVYNQSFPQNIVATDKIINFEGVGRYNISEFVNIGHMLIYDGFLFSIEGETFNVTNFELLICSDKNE